MAISQYTLFIIFEQIFSLILINILPFSGISANIGKKIPVIIVSAFYLLGL